VSLGYGPKKQSSHVTDDTIENV